MHAKNTPELGDPHSVHRLLRGVTSSAVGGLLVRIAVLLIPIATALVYFLHSNHLPESDGSRFLMFGHYVYDGFLKGGVSGGLRVLYEVRDWKPTIFHIFVPPFLFLARGKIYPAFVSTALFITTATTLYSYALAKRRLPALSASIAAAFVTSLPIFLYLSAEFYSEIAQPLLLIAAIYHLIESDQFSSTGHVIVAAIFTTLALCIRPDQTIIMALPVILVSMARAYRSGKVAWLDLVLCAAVVLLVATMLFLKALSSAQITTFPTSGSGGAVFFLRLVDRFLAGALTLLALLIPVLFVLARKAARVTYSIIGFVSTISVVTLIWFYPFSMSLYEWVYRTTFGDIAPNFAGASIAFWPALWDLLTCTGSFLMISSAVLAVVGLVATSRQREEDGWAAREGELYLFLSASALVGFVIVGMAGNVSPQFSGSAQAWRRLMAPFCLYLLAFAMAGLRAGRYLAIRQVFAVCILLLQATAIGMVIAGADSGFAKERAYVSFLQKPQILIPEPNGEVIAMLNQMGLAVSRVDIEGYTDVTAGGIILLKEITPTRYFVANDYIPSYVSKDEIRNAARQYSHIVFSVTPPTQGSPDQMNQAIRDLWQKPDANSHRMADILLLHGSGDLAKYGLELVRSATLGHSEVFIFASKETR
jgi:hypothetical protein